MKWLKVTCSLSWKKINITQSKSWHIGILRRTLKTRFASTDTDTAQIRDAAPEEEGAQLSTIIVYQMLTWCDNYCSWPHRTPLLLRASKRTQQLLVTSSSRILCSSLAHLVRAMDHLLAWGQIMMMSVALWRKNGWLLTPAIPWLSNAWRKHEKKGRKWCQRFFKGWAL